MNPPADFRIPGRDRLFHSPSAGSSLAGTSPFCLLHTCSNAACLTSTRTSEPSSCAPGGPEIIRIGRMVRKQWHLQRRAFLVLPQHRQKKIPPRVSLVKLYISLSLILCRIKMSYPLHQESFPENHILLVRIHPARCPLEHWALPVPTCSGSNRRGGGVWTVSASPSSHPQPPTHTHASLWSQCGPATSVIHHTRAHSLLQRPKVDEQCWKERRFKMRNDFKKITQPKTFYTRKGKSCVKGGISKLSFQPISLRMQRTRRRGCRKHPPHGWEDLFGVSSHSDEEPAAAGRPPLSCPAAAVPDGTTQPSEWLLRIMVAGEAERKKGYYQRPPLVQPHTARPGHCSTPRVLLLIPVRPLIKNIQPGRHAKEQKIMFGTRLLTVIIIKNNLFSWLWLFFSFFVIIGLFVCAGCRISELLHLRVQTAAVGYEIWSCYLCVGLHSHRIRSCSETRQGWAVIVRQEGRRVVKRTGSTVWRLGWQRDVTESLGPDLVWTLR